ncbi:hypothetical protein BREVNS_0838 [Brevinematales bacterium NS]|nr:hypothetical protein BREVNS_0838 [Brevinematales bacterium NS]
MRPLHIRAKVSLVCFFIHSERKSFCFEVLISLCPPFLSL